MTHQVSRVSGSRRWHSISVNFINSYAFTKLVIIPSHRAKPGINSMVTSGEFYMKLILALARSTVREQYLVFVHCWIHP